MRKREKCNKEWYRTEVDDTLTTVMTKEQEAVSIWYLGDARRARKKKMLGQAKKIGRSELSEHASVNDWR